MRSTLLEVQLTTRITRRHNGLLVFVLAILLSISTSAGSASVPFTAPADITLYHLAEQNDAAAQFLIGRKYYTGNGISKNIDEAIKWFELAATQKHVKAQFQLGKIYLYGDSGIKPNFLYALNYLKDAAKSHSAEAQFELGNYFLMGKSENVNYPEAIKWYRAAADQQNVRAMVELGKILNEGRGGINPQPDQAKHYLSLAAESGNNEAMNYLRDMVRHGSEGVRNAASITEFHSTLNDAAAGHIPSQYAVGMAYLKGMGVEADMKLAAKWLRRAAMNDHADAQYRLSQLYRDGVGIEKNRRRALEWLKIAASAGVSEAQNELRSMHLSGSSLAEFDEINAMANANKPSGSNVRATGSEDIDTAQAHTDAPSSAESPLIEDTLLIENTSQTQSASQYQLSKSTGQTDQPSPTGAPENEDFYSIDLNPMDAEKQYLLANRYLTGKNLFKDTGRAAYWFEQAARQKHVQAQYQLGEMYKHGKGVTASLAKAKFWLSSAASAGMVEAEISLRDLDGIPLAQQSNVVKTNVSISNIEQDAMITSLENGNRQKDSAIPAPSNLPDPDQSNMSDNELPTTTGMISMMGKGITTTNGVDDEIKNLIEAAHNNDPDAQLKLADMYHKGRGVDRDLDAAVQWYKKSAVAGEAEAQFKLGDMYKRGAGVEKNNALAIKWYRKAANQGHEEARHRLGGCRIC